MRILTIILLLTFIARPIQSFKDVHINKNQQLIIIKYNPLYPASVKRENKLDTLKVKAKIDTNGFVNDIQVLKSTGLNTLDSIAIHAAYKYRYVPFYSESKPNSCWINETIIFDTTMFLDIGEIRPEIVEIDIPKYPRLAWQAGIEGNVWIRVLVDTNGEVVKCKILKTSGTNALDDAATDVAYKCKFNSGSVNGNKMKMWFTYQVSFTNNRFYLRTRTGAKH